MSSGSLTPDLGEICRPGFIGRLLGRPPRIVREANFAAAFAALPAGAMVERTDSRGNWIAFRSVDEKGRILFRANEAWLAAEPTNMPHDSKQTAAAVLTDGTVLVYEGLHRARATARDRILIDEGVGGVPSAPGWLEFNLVEELPPATPSTRAIMGLMGNDPDSPPVPAR